MDFHAQYLSLDDARLAHQARTDPEAFAELYRRHVQSVYPTPCVRRALDMSRD